MKILAVIVNYKTPDMTLDAISACLRELAHYPDARVSVVDNDSRDGSYDKLRSAVADAGWSDRVEVVESDHNGGFAYGNNFAIRPALERADKPDYVYLLNSDAFPDTGCIERLVEFLDAHPEAGIAGSYVHGPEPVPHKTAFRFPTPWSELESTLGLGIVSKLLDRHLVALPMPEATQQVDWTAAASMLVRREMLDQIGLMDDGYFLYFEETDFCLRARRAGWSCWYVVESSVTHIGSVSTGYQDRSRPTPTFWYASRRRYFLDNHGRLTLWAANLAFVAGALMRRVRYLLTDLQPHEPKRHLRDFLAFNLRPVSAHPKRD